MKKTLLALVLALGLASAAQAQVVDVQAPWIRATVPAGKASGAFMQLKARQDVRLVAVRSRVAGNVEIHQMAMDGQMMKMQAVSGIDLPAGKTVDLASGGYHIMLMDLKKQLKEGDTVPLTLVLQAKGKKTETVALDVPVKALTYSAPKTQP